MNPRLGNDEEHDEEKGWKTLEAEEIFLPE
jgi:hypothetical protein